MISAFVSELIEVARIDERVVLIVIDSGPPEVLEFKLQFPERFIDVGIAEANAVSIACGFAIEGYKPVVLALARYLVGRAYDQIRQAVGVMAAPITFVGAGSGFSLGGMGPTHHCLDDIGLVRMIPGLDIQVASTTQAARCMARMLWPSVPRYIRLESLVGSDHAFDYSNLKRGKFIEIRQGRNATILFAGCLQDMALEAREVLGKIGVDAGVVDAAFIRPLDRSRLAEYAQLGPLITLEEHGPGGLGAAVLMELVDTRHWTFSIEVSGTSSQCSSRRELRRLGGLTVDRIVMAIKTILRREAHGSENKIGI